MAIQRAVVKGRIASLVETRQVFTCDVVTQGSDDYETLWRAYLNSVYAAAQAMLSNVWLAYEAEFQAPIAGSWVPFLSIVWNYAGTVAGDYLPNTVAAVLLGKAPGLRHIGRKFFGPIPETGQSANSLVGAVLTAAAATCLAYITPFTGLSGGTIDPGVVDAAGDFHPFTGGLVSSLLGSMRRRKPGLGI